MWKSGLKIGLHHAILWVLEVRRSKILQKLNARDSCLHFGFIFYGVSRTKTDLHNK